MRISSHTHYILKVFSAYPSHSFLFYFSSSPPPSAPHRQLPHPFPAPCPAPVAVSHSLWLILVCFFTFCFHLVTIWTGCWNRLQYLYQHLLLNITSLGWRLVVIFILMCTVYGWFLALFSRACWQSVLVAMMCWCLATPFLQAPRPLCSASWFAWTRAPCHCVSWCTCVYIVYRCFQSFDLRRVEREWNWMNTGKRRIHLIVNVK